ncbi:FOG: Transposase [Streptomyces sp. MA5143a]|nr:FOG: Transposase [Streptomyces sp. MA5143a]
MRLWHPHKQVMRGSTPRARAAVAASGNADFGSVDSLITIEDRHKIPGDWGEIIVQSRTPFPVHRSGTHYLIQTKLTLPPYCTPPRAVSALAAEVDGQRFTEVTWRQGSKGAMTSRFAVLSVRPSGKQSLATAQEADGGRSRWTASCPSGRSSSNGRTARTLRPTTGYRTCPPPHRPLTWCGGRRGAGASNTTTASSNKVSLTLSARLIRAAMSAFAVALSREPLAEAQACRFPLQQEEVIGVHYPDRPRQHCSHAVIMSPDDTGGASFH